MSLTLLNNRPAQNNATEASASLCLNLTKGVALFVNVARTVIEAQKEVPNVANFSQPSGMFRRR